MLRSKGQINMPTSPHEPDGMCCIAEFYVNATKGHASSCPLAGWERQAQQCNQTSLFLQSRSQTLTAQRLQPRNTER